MREEVKLVSSPAQEASEALASVPFLKTVLAILCNIMLAFCISGLIQHLPQQNLVVYYKTLPGPLHKAAA